MNDLTWKAPDDGSWETATFIVIYDNADYPWWRRLIRRLQRKSAIVAVFDLDNWEQL